MKRYFAWAKPKNSTNCFCMTYLNADNIKTARECFKDKFELNSKVYLAKNQ